MDPSYNNPFAGSNSNPGFSPAPVVSGEGDIVLQPEKKSKKGPVIAIATLVLAAVIGVVAVLLVAKPFGGDNGKGGGNEAVKALDSYVEFMTYGTEDKEFEVNEENEEETIFDILKDRSTVMTVFQNSPAVDKTQLYEKLKEKFEELEKKYSIDKKTAEQMTYYEDLLEIYYLYSMVMQNDGEEGVETSMKNRVAEIAKNNENNFDKMVLKIASGTLNDFIEKGPREKGWTILANQSAMVYSAMVQALADLRINLAGESE